MGDFDLKCLATDFVGKSRPSKVLNALYVKKEEAEKKAILDMEVKKQAICKDYEYRLEKQSDELKRNLQEIRGIIKDELYDSKIKSNADNASFLENYEFNRVYKRIRDYTQQQHDLVENFYLNAVKMEKDKSNRFKDVLKDTYEEIKRVSFKLPRECDELIELEIEKTNQTILCNNRNYVELKTQLQAEIESQTKTVIQELQLIKERWVKIAQTQTEAELRVLRNQYSGDLTKIADNLKEKVEEASLDLNVADSLTKVQNADEWLNNIRQILANLDQNAQKIIINYKQAVIIIHNRFFQELKVIGEALMDINNDHDFPKEQTEIYTPTMEDMMKIHDDVEQETIQMAWKYLVDQLTTTIDNTHKFLVVGACLWQKHFKRTEVLQAIMLKDVENTVKINSRLSEPYETKLNILIDTLRQESTKDRLKKTLGDIHKLLVAIETLYKSQHRIEMDVMKKYKSAQELKIDVLLAEVKRFLAVYPPDMERDPKIQRKRASQTSEISNPTDALIPNQMIYSQFQIGAIGNWQFGLWESIGNYMAVAKSEIIAETDKWIQSHLTRVDRRLEVRLGIHALRMEKLQAYIYEERLEELCAHQSRIAEHKSAVDKRLVTLKNEYKSCQDAYENITKTYNSKVSDIEMETLESENSYDVTSSKATIKATTEKYVGQITATTAEYLQKCDAFFNYVKTCKILMMQNIKLFSEGGNFSIYEIRDILKSVDKVEAQVDKVIANIKKEVDTKKVTTIEKIHARSAEVFNTIKAVTEEHRFTDNLEKKRQCLQKELIREVCTLQYTFKALTKRFEQSKIEIVTNCGDYNYFKEFSNKVQDIVEKLNKLAEYLNEATPVRFYSDKSAAELAPTTSRAASSPRTRKTEDQRVQEITESLFNFEFRQDRDTYFMNLNKILQKYWNDIIVYAKAFYKAHHRCFFLDEEKVHHSLFKLMKDLYKTFFHMQNQCETRSMQDTKEYINFASNWLMFICEHIEIYITEYGRKTVKTFQLFCETKVSQSLAESKREVKNKYAQLQKKLKSLHGHPKNKKLLEKLQIEAEIIDSEAKDSLADFKNQHLDCLEDRFGQAVNEYYELQKLIPEISQVTHKLQTVIRDLGLKLNEKVNLLRMMVDYCPLEKSKSTNQIIISHCRSFLTLYNSKSIPHLTENSGNIEGNLNLGSSLEFEQSSTEDTMLTKSPPSSLSKTVASTAITLGTEDTDPFLSDLRESHEKYCEEIEAENFKDFLADLKKEWYNEVHRVLDLYSVKYDPYRI